MGDDIEVSGLLRGSGEQLEKAGIVHAMVIIVPGVHIEGGLGHGAGADIQYVGKSLAHGGIQRLMHVGDALAGRKV